MTKRKQPVPEPIRPPRPSTPPPQDRFETRRTRGGTQVWILSRDIPLFDGRQIIGFYMVKGTSKFVITSWFANGNWKSDLPTVTSDFDLII